MKPTMWELLMPSEFVRVPLAIRPFFTPLFERAGIFQSPFSEHQLTAVLPCVPYRTDV